VSADGVSAYHQADGFIVGTSLKEGGRVDAPVDASRVRALADAIAALRAVS
jgi:predicted TIM-barrel enzyme